MDKISEAIILATRAHEGQKRKIDSFPYILHPLEVASVITSLTSDEDVICAGIMHDVLEDTPITKEELTNKFGSKVCALVMGETEDKSNKDWYTRKSESINRMKASKDINVKIMWLADKLSNIRSIYRAYNKQGEEVWNYFRMKDPRMHKWYYESVLEGLEELKDTLAYQYYKRLVEEVFDKYK